MDKTKFEQEYLAELHHKMNLLKEDDCPLTTDEWLAYKEGWRAAFMLAEDIFVRKWKDISWIGVEPPKEFMDAVAKNMTL